MKYFAKYLPVEGENVQIGTKVKYLLAFGAIGTVTRIDGDRAYTDEGTDINGEFSISASKDPKYLIEIISHNKLFLCSRDIQVGDKVMGLLLDKSGYKEHTLTNSNEEVKLAIESGDFKVIGEILTPGIIENQEFTEKEIEFLTIGENIP